MTDLFTPEEIAILSAEIDAQLNKLTVEVKGFFENDAQLPYQRIDSLAWN